MSDPMPGLVPIGVPVSSSRSTDSTEPQVLKRPRLESVSGEQPTPPMTMVRVKSMSSPSSTTSIASPPSQSVSSFNSPTSPCGFVTTKRVPSASIQSATSSPSAYPFTADAVTRWSAFLTKAIMTHWPGDREHIVKERVSQIVRHLPQPPTVAANQVRVLGTAFRDPKHSELRNAVMGDLVDWNQLTRMNELELLNPEAKARLEREFQERNKAKDWTELKKAMQTSSDMFPCPKCGARDCMWEQRQTRSADEPMTIIATCNRCGFYWRKRG